MMDAIQNIGIVGAGVMGRGIAEVVATSGLTATLMDQSDRALASAVGEVRAAVEKRCSRGELDEAAARAALGRLARTTHLESVAAASDLVIEAVPEDEELKCDVLAALGAAAPPETILVSNTSALPITRLAAATGRADRFAGFHFMNPAPVLKLVEVVRGSRTSDATVEALLALAKRLGKVPVVVKDAPGFVVNRVLMPMINEAARLFESGAASAADIDAAMRTGASHPMGPLALADFIGLDVVVHNLRTLQSAFGGAHRPAPILERLVAEGKLGRRSGRGFHRYRKDAP